MSCKISPGLELLHRIWADFVAHSKFDAVGTSTSVGSARVALVPIDHFVEPTLWSMDWHGTCVQLRSLGFQHLDLEVTVPRVGIFRDAIVDLFEMATCLMSQKGARSRQQKPRNACVFYRACLKNYKPDTLECNAWEYWSC